MKKTMQKFMFFLAAIFAISLITACSSHVTGGGVKTYSVRINYSDSEAVTLSVEEGETLSSLAGFVLPSKENYTFVGFKTSGGDSFGVNDPVLSDLILYVKFYKSEVDEGTGTSTSIEECSDGTSSSTTKNTNEDGTVTTVTENTDSDGKTTKVEVVETQDDDGSTTTVTTTTDSDGKTTTVEVVETQNDDGSITTVTTTTDSDGNTSTQTEKNDDTARFWVTRGLEVLRGQYENYAGLGNLAAAINEAKGYFEKAYQVDPTDDEAKIYSALCNLSDIATNTKIKNFARNRLGITNYPSSLEDLIKGDWLTAEEYKEKYDAYIYGAIMTEAPKPYGNSGYYFRASLDDNGDYKGCSYMVTKCPEAPDGYFAYMWSEHDYRRNIGEYMEPPRNLQNRRFRLDDNGEYLIYVYCSPYDSNYAELQNYTAYQVKNESNESIRYSYYKTTKAPVFSRQFKNNWISAGVDSGIKLWELFLANALEGNTNGLNGAIDDLYDALFGSEYESACSKINAINSPVTISAWAVKALGLDKVFGTSNVRLGKTELKLVKTVLDLFKFIFEYLQSYNLDSDLSVLKVEWDANFYSERTAISYLQDNLASYNPSIDPIAQGFLDIRSSQKMADSKQTLLSILDDVITAYSEITGPNSIYPQAFKDFLVGSDGLGNLLYDGAQKLRTALINGTKFYIPIEDFINGRVPASWPVSGSDWVDTAKAFTPGLFSVENCIELNQQRKPVFYKVNNTYINSRKVIIGDPITSAQDFKDYFVLMQEERERRESGNWNESYEETWYAIASSGLPFHQTMSSLSSIWNNYVLKSAIQPEDYMHQLFNWGDGPQAAFFYNFYYGGLEDLISEFSK